jgi:hypothetical protein
MHRRQREFRVAEECLTQGTDLLIDPFAQIGDVGATARHAAYRNVARACASGVARVRRDRV